MEHIRLWLLSNSNKPTKMQRRQEQLADQLIASISGNGPYSDLFNMNEAVFQKSYVDPAKQVFKSQIAPQIQESFVSQGQQGSTGMETALTRAGIDLDQMLNQAMMQFQQQGQQNKMQTINTIMGAGAGPAAELSPMERALQGLSGAVTGSDFRQEIASIPGYFENKRKRQEQQMQQSAANQKPLSVGYVD